eukprot:NODE_2901_length_1093_cov_40.453065_g2662_i0.p1 GENE.NODE_2901_length_1093_cov_40.453065_g2662_i0~~NODE_2901_length_1093_cov_40.453065_g2662_i0.p1  ORF type:complete len:185 (-),score=42.23 NODE_2901_length_1093_cov_40.453065_g2662_i0:381-935(-)
MADFGALLAPLRKSPKFLDAIETLLKLIQNLILNPKEEKFQRIRVTNPTLQQRVFALDGAYEFIVALGWEPEGEFMIMRNPDVELLQRARQELQRTTGYVPVTPKPTSPVPDHIAAERAAREQAMRARQQTDEKLRKQILAEAQADREANKNRRAAASQGRELPFGGQVTRYGDIGVDLGKGGG